MSDAEANTTMNSTSSMRQMTGATQMLAGELSFQTAALRYPALRTQVDSAIACFDLAQLGRCDSAGLAVLVSLQAQANHAGRRLSFINPPPQLQQLIKVSAVAPLFQTEED